MNYDYDLSKTERENEEARRVRRKIRYRHEVAPGLYIDADGIFVLGSEESSD